MNLAAMDQLSDQNVYQATKDIFVGQKAKFRKVIPVRKCIEKHSKKDDAVRGFVALHGAEAVCQIVLKLLASGVYESTLIASSQFPDLFNPSTSQSAASDMLEAEAIKNEQTALDGIIQSQLTESQGTLDGEESVVPLHDLSTNAPNSQERTSPSLFPVYLPFPTEHLLMERLQKTLECACYEFGARVMPDELRDRGWDCPESVELSKWTEILKRDGVLERENTRKTMKELLRSIASIRHTAVHRLRTSSAGLELFIADAEDLVEVLGDPEYSKSISQLRKDISSAIMELKQNKQFLQLQLEHTKASIEQQHAELDRREQEAIENAKEEDKKYQILAGDKVQKALEVMENSEVTTNGSMSLLGDVNGVEDIADDDDDDVDNFEDCEEGNLLPE